MILADSSAWIEYLRATGSPLNIRMRGYREATQELAITEVVAMELLAGVRTDREEARAREIIEGVPLLRTHGLPDFDQAAALYRACRRGGETVRRMTDCLIAAVAIRNDVPVLHHDADFDVLARHTELQIA